MEKNSHKEERITTASLFIIIPTLMLIVGYYINPYESTTPEITSILIQIPMFLGLILLLIGFFKKEFGIGNKIKILGWFIFAFYWATQPASLYFSEGGDIFNAAVCIIGVYVLCYIAYHEWLSLKRKENISCINWLAGASAFAGIIYFGIERTALAQLLINEVAKESAMVLNTIIGNAYVVGEDIYFNGEYTVTIIFACTAIQSMVIFVGMIGALPRINIKRKIIGLIITLIPIYFLNLFRNAMVTFLTGNNITDFNMAHNIISKAGALIILIVLLVILIKLIPEIFDEIVSFTELYKRNGPIEKTIKRTVGGKNGETQE